MGEQKKVILTYYLFEAASTNYGHTEFIVSFYI